MTKAFAGIPAVDDVTLSLPPGSFTALLGPSGCGKSTLLALVAGLLAPDRGTVEVDDRDVTALPAERRPVGLVFQKPLLLPHLNVEDNVAFGLRMRRIARAERRRAVQEVLDAVGLGALARRRVGELSGGQEQRVALARALVLAPRLLLLDEPFSQLDAQLRIEMRALVRRLTADAATTTLFVTHDQGEAVDVADGIALMLAGRLVGHAAPEVFYRDPPSLAAARFFGVTNELPGTVRSGCFMLRIGDGRVVTGTADGPAVAVVRPEALRLAAATEGVAARTEGEGLRLPGVVREARFAGTHLVATVGLEADRLVRVQLPVGTPVTVGAPVTVIADGNVVRVFPAESR